MITSSFSDWLADHDLAPIVDGVTTQSYFSTNYTAWLTEIFNEAEVRQYLLNEHGIALDATLAVKLNQNDPSGSPYVEVAGVAYDVFDAFFSDITDVTVKTGKTFQERYFSDTFTFGDANHAPTDIALDVTFTPGGNDIPAGSVETPLVLGQLSTVDPDAGDTHTYQLEAGSSAGFAVSTAGEVTVTANLAESSTYTLVIKTTDQDGASYTETVNVITGTKSAAPGTGVDNPLPTGGASDPILAGDDVLFAAGGTDTLYGGAGNDTLFGQGAADRLVGGAGNDTMSGGEQADTYVFLQSDGGGVDTIKQFTAAGAQHDVLDISDLLTGYVDGTSNLSDFVSFVDNGTDTTVRVDANGTTGGANFQDTVVLQGVTGVALATLLSDVDPVV